MIDPLVSIIFVRYIVPGMEDLEPSGKWIEAYVTIWIFNSSNVQGITSSIKQFKQRCLLCIFVTIMLATLAKSSDLTKNTSVLSSCHLYNVITYHTLSTATSLNFYTCPL